VTRFRLVEAEAAQFPVSLLCRVVGVTRQGFYAWKRRPPSARELADRKLAKRIREIYTETDEIYGASRVYSELKLGDGIPIGKKRVAPNPPFPRTRTEFWHPTPDERMSSGTTPRQGPHTTPRQGPPRRTHPRIRRNRSVRSN